MSVIELYRKKTFDTLEAAAMPLRRQKIAKFIYPTCIRFRRRHREGPSWNFAIGKTGMIRLPCADTTMMIIMLSRLHFTYNTGTRQTDRRTDRIAITTSRIVLTRGKKLTQMLRNDAKTYCKRTRMM